MEKFRFPLSSLQVSTAERRKLGGSRPAIDNTRPLTHPCNNKYWDLVTVAALRAVILGPWLQCTVSSLAKRPANMM